MDNAVSIAGNLTEDPELRFSPSGQAVAGFSIAVNRRTKDAQGNWQDGEPSFFRRVCFGSLAENATESLVKGARAVIVGRLQQSTWQADDGSKRSSVEIVVDDVGPSLKWATADVTKNHRKQEPQTAGTSSWS